MIEAKSFDPAWDTWRRVDCKCGNKYCTYNYMNISFQGGKLEPDDARLAVSAPKLLKALAGIMCNETTYNKLHEGQRREAEAALVAALGTEKVRKI